MPLTKDVILKQIKPVDDPDLGMSLVDMGLIYDIKIINKSRVEIKMTLSSPACPIGPHLMAMVKKAVLDLEDVKETEVELVWDPPWDPATMATDTVKDALGIW
jgi:metal-sulfur cluster biosynthetic enzyme